MEATAIASTPLLTTRTSELCARVRFLSIGLAVAFVAGALSAYWPFDDALDGRGTPVGGDFPMFYVAGQTVASGHIEQLYDPAAQQQRLHELFPNLAPDYTLPYRYPPLVAGLMAPVARLPYSLALALFTLASCLAWCAATRLWVRSMVDARPARTTIFVFALGFPVCWEVVLGGQASHAALLVAVFAMALLKDGRQIPAGLVLGCACYKPNVLAFFVLGCVLRYPRSLIGIAITCAIALVGSWWMVGVDGLVSYFEYATHLAVARWDLETPPWKVHGLGAWVALLAPGRERMVLLVLGGAATGLLAARWRRSPNDANSFTRYTALLLVVNALGNPYVPIYDLVLLLPVALLILRSACDASLSRSAFALACGTLLLLAFGPHLSQALTKSTLGPQCFPMLLLLVGQAFWLVHPTASAAPR